MRGILTAVLGLGLLATVLGGCGDEDPTAVGSEIIEERFRTYEVVLEPSEFLQGDTTYDRLGSVHGTPFTLVAHSFGGDLFAHTLFPVIRPSRVSYVAPDSTSVTDSVFTIIGATVTVVFDTVWDVTGPVDLELLELTERWDRSTLTWDLRADTADDPVAWTEPGGTTDRLLGTGTWSSEDTVRIALDSAAAMVLADSAGAVNGALIRSVTADTRLRIQSLDFAFDVRPETVDTIVPAGSAGGKAFVVTPEPTAPDETELRIGGLPSWRSVLHFRRLEEVSIPCGPDVTGCTISLADVNVNLASLVLQPLPVDSRRIERPMRVEGRVVLRAPGVPITRSALATSLGRMGQALEPTLFTAAPEAPRAAQVPLTYYVRRNLDPPEGEDAILWVALVGESETGTPVFGYGAFGSMSSDTPPRLRLVVTAPAREVTQ